MAIRHMTRHAPLENAQHGRNAGFRLFRNEKQPLIAVTGIISLTLAIVTFSSLTNTGRVIAPSVDVAAERRLVITDTDNGAIAIYDADTDRLLGHYESGEGGFARTAIRALAFTRHNHNIPNAKPLSLQQAANERLYLVDPETGRSVDLNAFGPANADQFRQWLEPLAVAVDETS